MNIDFQPTNKQDEVFELLEDKNTTEILFGGGVSTIITETLEIAGGSPMFLSDFGGNPPYERMLGTVKICLKHKLKDAKLLLILGGKANNTFIDVTFQAISDALVDYVEEHGPIQIPVIVGQEGHHQHAAVRWYEAPRADCESAGS